MKKALALLLALVMCLSLAACGGGNKSSESTNPSTETTLTTSTEFEETFPSTQSSLVLYDSDKTTYEELDQMIVNQGNRHNLNSLCFDEDWIYGAWYGEDYTGEIVKVRTDSSDWTVIDPDTNGKWAYCRAIEGEYLYYSQENDNGIELIKVHSSGEDAKVIIANHSASIQIVGTYIYYTTPDFWLEDYSGVTDESSHLYRCDLNGENVEAILETPVYYFTVFGDYILYQDDRDDMTLHIYNTSSGENVRINEQRSYYPIYDGNYIYYLSDSESPEEYQFKLWRVSLDGAINEEIDLGCSLDGLLLRGDYIYYINSDDSARIYRCHKDGSQIELITQDTNISAFQWVKEGLAYMTRDEEGYISGLYLCDADGANRIEFCKSENEWSLD